MNSRAGYRLNAFAVWRKAVIQIFLEINFPSGGTAQSAACDGWEQSPGISAACGGGAREDAAEGARAAR